MSKTSICLPRKEDASLEQYGPDDRGSQSARESLIKYVDLMTCHIFCYKSEIQSFLVTLPDPSVLFIKTLIMWNWVLNLSHLGCVVELNSSAFN